MTIVRTNPFKDDFKKLPEEIKSLAEKNLRLLLANPRHPSLRIKKMGGTKEIWEARLSANYRLTFHKKNDIFILRRIGTHDVLRRP